MKKKKVICILSSMIFLSFILIIILIIIKNKDEKLENLEGKILINTSNYVILESNNIDYLISNKKGNYNVGDIVKVSYKKSDLDTEEEPFNLKIIDEEIISVNNTGNTVINRVIDNTKKDETVDDKLIESGKEESISNNSFIEKNTTDNDLNIDNIIANLPTNMNSVDSDVVAYFTDLEKKADNSNLETNLKTGFVSIVDFLFYDGTIKGHKFNDLTNTAKLKIISIAIYFDNKIDKYFPGYKENISKTTNKVYTEVREKALELYLSITTSICADNVELCQNAKNTFQDLKTNFNLSWSLVKDIATDGLSNLKEWYEVWKSK